MKQLIPSTRTVATVASSLVPAMVSKIRIATPVPSNKQLPRRSQAEGVDSQTYEREYEKAVIALEAEQHEFTGIWDLVKSLCMWFETPEERMRKNGYEAPECIFSNEAGATVPVEARRA